MNTNNSFQYFDNNLSSILSAIRGLTAIESNSGDLRGISRAIEFIADQLSPYAALERIESEAGPLLHAKVIGVRPERILLLAHTDTVYPAGTWENLWRIEDNRAYAPGIVDMKGCIIQACWAIRAFEDLSRDLGAQVELLVTPDEEVGSRSSRRHIEALAKGAKAVFVIEPPSATGDLKIARKGVGDITVTVSGVAAHQGAEPEKGRNAIVSAAHLILQLDRIQSPESGTLLGANMISGGVATNVVADHAEVKIDLRSWSLSDAERALAELRAIEPLDGTSYDFSGGLNRPPLEPTEQSRALFKLVQQIGTSLGLSLQPARVGGGSDGNFTANIAPTLDGLGLYGGGAHQVNREFIYIDQIALRCAMLHEALAQLMV